MDLDVKPLVKLLKQKDAKKAREWLELNRGEINPDDEFYRGYLLAFQGMVSALESGGGLSAVSKILENKYEHEQVSGLLRGTRTRLSQKFRPKDERGFDTAWVDFLNEISGEKA
ncbi:MAG: hypothetical protein ABH852_04735 [Methanobacteriota archaeon]